MADQKNKSAKKKKHAKELLFWVGGIAAAIVSLTAVYDKLVAPRGANLRIVFFESQSGTLRLVPSIHSNWEFTEDVPVQLKIDNIGGKATGNTKLYLTFNEGVAVTTDYPHDEKNVLGKSNELMRQLAFKIENINPGESYLLPIKIRLRVGRPFQEIMARSAAMLSKDDQTKRMGFHIFADLSSDTLSNTKKDLEIIVGRCATLENDGDVFWLGHGDKGVLLLKVESDYPCE